jgi:hypothetical protein
MARSATPYAAIKGPNFSTHHRTGICLQSTFVTLSPLIGRSALSADRSDIGGKADLSQLMSTCPRSKSYRGGHTASAGDCSMLASRHAVYGYDQRIEALGSKEALRVENMVESKASFGQADGIVSEKPIHFSGIANSSPKLTVARGMLNCSLTACSRLGSISHSASTRKLSGRAL